MSKYRWMDQALCREVDPDLFTSDNTHDSRHAKKICQQCIVRNECLSWAIANPEMQGVLGGTTHRERQKLRGWKRGQQSA